MTPWWQGFCLGAAACIAGVWAISYLNEVTRERHEYCLEWRRQSASMRYIDGPAIAKGCRRYFAERSEEQAERDAAEWRARLDRARAEWAKSRERPEDGD